MRGIWHPFRRIDQISIWKGNANTKITNCNNDHDLSLRTIPSNSVQEGEGYSTERVSILWFLILRENKKNEVNIDIWMRRTHEQQSRDHWHEKEVNDYPKGWPRFHTKSWLQAQLWQQGPRCYFIAESSSFASFRASWSGTPSFVSPLTE